MTEKTTYDSRGWQANLIRQISFNKASFVHMVFYRVLIIAALVTFVTFLFSFVYAGVKPYINYLLAAVWILFTPQLFILITGLAMVGSGGLEFGHLNKSYLNMIGKSGKSTIGYRILPYAALIIWGVGFILFVYKAII